MERLSISFVPYNDGKYDLIIRDDNTYKEVTLSGSTKNISKSDEKLLYKLMPMCIYNHYKEISHKDFLEFKKDKYNNRVKRHNHGEEFIKC